MNPNKSNHLRADALWRPTKAEARAIARGVRALTDAMNDVATMLREYNRRHRLPDLSDFDVVPREARKQ